MHRFSSRSGVGASRWLARTVRMAKPKPHWQRYATHVDRVSTPAAPYGYVEKAGGTRLRVAERSRCSTPDGFAAPLENLCTIPARTTKAHTSLVTAASTQNLVESAYNIKEEWR